MSQLVMLELSFGFNTLSDTDLEQRDYQPFAGQAYLRPGELPSLWAFYGRSDKDGYVEAITTPLVANATALDYYPLTVREWAAVAADHVETFGRAMVQTASNIERLLSEQPLVELRKFMRPRVGMPRPDSSFWLHYWTDTNNNTINHPSLELTACNGFEDVRLSLPNVAVPYDDLKRLIDAYLDETAEERKQASDEQVRTFIQKYTSQ